MLSLNSHTAMSFIKGTIFIKIKALFIIWLTLYSHETDTCMNASFQ